MLLNMGHEMWGVKSKPHISCYVFAGLGLVVDSYYGEYGVVLRIN